MRLLLSVLIAVVLAPGAGQGQVQTPREAPRAFQRSVSLSLALGFHGTRAESVDSIDPRCPCLFEHSVGNGPHAALRFEEPVTRRTALRLGLDVSAPTHRLDLNGERERTSRSHSTALRGEAAILFRLKANVPVFFGLGGVFARFNPSAVELQGGQVDEVGGLITIGYDAVIQEAWNVRFEFLNYLMKPEEDGLPEGFEAKSLVRDWTLGIGVRYVLTR